MAQGRTDTKEANASHLAILKDLLDMAESAMCYPKVEIQHRIKLTVLCRSILTSVLGSLLQPVVQLETCSTQSEKSHELNDIRVGKTALIGRRCVPFFNAKVSRILPADHGELSWKNVIILATVRSWR